MLVEMVMGVVLMQGGQPIAFLSKAMGVKNIGLSVYKKALMALVMVVTKWRHYLVGYHFVINNHSKVFIRAKTNNHTTAQTVKLLGLDYEILCKRGSKNTVVDALSTSGQKVEEKSTSTVLC